MAEEMYKVDKRVGCIAVVDGSFDGPCLAADMVGVVAYWMGVRGKEGWEVPSWQEEKASWLCDIRWGPTFLAV